MLVEGDKTHQDRLCWGWGWDCSELSDVRVRLVHGQQDEQPWEKDMHSLVLATASAYFKFRLLDSTCCDSASVVGVSQQAPGSPGVMRVLEEHISPQLIHPAELALRFAYTQGLDPSVGNDVPLLTEVMWLASNWQMPSLISACLSAISKAPRLSIDDIHILLDPMLPEDIARHQLYRDICQQAMVQLFPQAHSVMMSQELQSQFLQLPFPAVLLWATSDELWADSENSVVALIDAWWCAQQRTKQSVQQPTQDHTGRMPNAVAPIVKCCGSFAQGSDQEQKELLSHNAVRLPHLSPTYLLWILPRLPWFDSGTEAYRLAAFRQGVAGSVGETDGEKCSNSKDRSTLPPALRVPARRHNRSHVIRSQWAVALPQLNDLHVRAMEGPVKLMAPQPLFWKGYNWHLYLALESQSAALQLGVQVRCATHTHMPLPALMLATFMLEVKDCEGASRAEVFMFSSPASPLPSTGEVASGTLLEVPAAKELRGGSIPPRHLLVGNQLNVSLIMQDVK